MKDGLDYSVACEYAGYRHSKNSLTKEEIENKYGLNYYFTSRILLQDEEVEFKEHYLTTDVGNVPYEIISKIEVVEK